MIRYLEELKSSNPELYKKAFQRVAQKPRYHEFAIRFTPKELQKAARFLDEYGMSWSLKQHDIFMSRFTQTEKEIIALLNKTNRKDKIEGIENKIRVANDRLARNIKAAIDDIQDEEELNELIRKQKVKRGEVVDSMSSDWKKLQEIF